MSGPIFACHQEPEMEITARPSIHPSSSTDPEATTLSFICIFQVIQVVVESGR